MQPGPLFAVDSAELADDVRFRQEFGLQSDVAAISEIVRSGASADAFGVPLTSDEVRDLQSRVAAEPAIAKLQQRLRQIPSFAGLYIDQAAGGVVDIAFTDPPSRHADVLAAHPIALEMRPRQVENSEGDLLALNELVTYGRDFHASLGIQANEVYPDIRANVVKVGIEPYSSEAVANLTDRYGDAIDVFSALPGERTVCTGRTNCPGPPLRAGLHLYDPGCTSAFLGKYTQSGTVRDVVLSAGHCANLVPTGHIYQHPNGTAMGGIGTMLEEVYFYGSNADAMVIRVGSSYASNRVYHTTTSYFGLSSIQSRSEEVGGMVVCQSSRISGVACGQLYAWGFSITYTDGTQLVDQRSATYAVSSGDSGGPVFYTTEARGIQSGVNTAGRAIYSHITFVISTIGNGLTINIGTPCAPCE